MVGTGRKILMLVLSLIIGIGVTYFGTSLIEPMFTITQTMQIVIAVVLTIFAYISFYFMAKGNG